MTYRQLLNSMAVLSGRQLDHPVTAGFEHSFQAIKPYGVTTYRELYLKLTNQPDTELEKEVGGVRIFAPISELDITNVRDEPPDLMVLDFSELPDDEDLFL